MSTFLQFAIVLVIIISAAKIGGLISLRLGQPSVLGELLAGLILGPSVLNLLYWAPFTDKHLGEVITLLAELGVLLLMFNAGLSLHLSELLRSGKVSVFSGLLGVLVPLGMGAAAAQLFGLSGTAAIFTGLILAATSVSISAQTLMEMGVLRSRVGIGLLGAAVLDDILVVLGISVFMALTLGAEGGLGSVVAIAVRMLLYIGIAIAIGIYFIPRLTLRIDNLPISHGLIAFTFVVTILFAWTSEVLGSMAAITGAFLAGLVFARSPSKERIEGGMSSLAYGVFVPIFFVNVGLAANIRDLSAGGTWLFIVLCLIAIVSKLLGGSIGARLAGFTNREAIQLGTGMISRGEVGLIVATVGISEGLIEPDIFSVVVGIVIVTTLLTPLLLRGLFRRQSNLALNQ